MSADRNEALRLADALVKAYPHIYTGLAPSAAALLCQQAERIAELEARVHTCGPTCSKAGCINRRLTTERDQLRAEVERLRVDAERYQWLADCENFYESICLIANPRLTAHDLGAAIDHARTTHKDEG